MPSSRRNRVIDLKKPQPTREDTRWAVPPTPTRASSSKPQRLRNRRRKQRALMLSVCTLLAAGLVGGLGFASHAERLAIKNITIEGAQQLSAHALTTSVENTLTNTMWKIFAKRNMFLYPAGEIEQKLVEEFPRIKEVELSRPALLAQAVTVSVVEREPYALWCNSAETCYFLDVGGFIFAESSSAQTPTHPYVFYGGLLPKTDSIGQIFLKGRLAEMMHLIGLLKDAGYETKSITVQNEKDFSIVLNDGLELRIPFAVESSVAVRDLKIALEADSVRGHVNNLEYVDLRFGNRVYYKFRGE